MTPSSRPFVVARNPNPHSRLPYLVILPVAGEAPIALAVRESWPVGKDLYCHRVDEPLDDIEVVDEQAVRACWREGKAVHLVLARRSRKRSMFVWTRNRQGRTLIFWRTPRTMSGARPGIRVPQARGLERRITIAVDTRERYPWRFSMHDARTERRELPVGDYGVLHDDRLVAAVERKRPDDLANAATGGRLAFLLQELDALPHAALVVEGRLSDLMKMEHARAGWLLNLVAALQVQFPRIQWVFAETRKIAEDFAYRWLAATLQADRLRDQRDATDLAYPVHPAGMGASKASVLREGHGMPGAPVHDRAGRQREATAAAQAGHIWTSREYADRFGISRNTALQDLKDLVEQGVVMAEGARRNRRYVWAGASHAADLSPPD